MGRGQQTIVDSVLAEYPILETLYQIKLNEQLFYIEH